MTARILPLSGKYYGTRVEIAGVGEITVWVGGDSPSDRELAGAGLTREQWNTNALVPDGMGGVCPAKELDWLAGPHCESQRDYELAGIIVDAIGGGNGGSLREGTG